MNFKQFLILYLAFCIILVVSAAMMLPVEGKDISDMYNEKTLQPFPRIHPFSRLKGVVIY